MDVICLLVLASLLLCNGASAISPLTFIHDLLQYNIAGIPITHETTVWDLDPLSGLKRRAQYEKDNGPKGKDLIQRLGLGAEFSGS